MASDTNVSITEDEYARRKVIVLKGCMYIAMQYNTPDSKRLSYDKQVSVLKQLGCIFNTTSVANMFQFEKKYKGLKGSSIEESEDFVVFGELILSRYMTSEDDAHSISNLVLLHDDQSKSIYAYLRRMSGDDRYTKDYFVQSGLKNAGDNSDSDAMLTDADYAKRRELSVSGCIYLAYQYNLPNSMRDSYKEQISKLTKIGCIFEDADIKRMLTFETKFKNLTDRMIDTCDDHVVFGENLIASYVRAPEGCAYVEYMFLQHDGEGTIYSYLRHITGDSKYTKEYFSHLCLDSSVAGWLKISQRRF